MLLFVLLGFVAGADEIIFCFAQLHKPDEIPLASACFMVF